MATVEQIKAARALLGWSQENLAEHSGISLPTVRRFEARSKLRVSEDARRKLEAALEAVGIEFTNGGAPGVRLRRKE